MIEYFCVDVHTVDMTEGPKLFRVELHVDNPKKLAGSANFQRCSITVEHWHRFLKAVRRHHQPYWIEVFDAATGKLIAGPFAPDAQVPDTVDQ